MTNAILRGKPDAGNPHVRFDEGEVASAKPRRGSLLYKYMRSIRALLTGKAFSLAAISLLVPAAALAETETPLWEQENRPCRILSIGNSFSAQIEDGFPAAAKAIGKPVDFLHCKVGASTLQNHSDNLDTLGYYTMVVRFTTSAGSTGNPFGTVKGNATAADWSTTEILKALDWDVVTLQQRSITSSDVNSYDPYLGILVAKIRELCPTAKIYFHQTWTFDRYGPASWGKEWGGDVAKRDAFYDGINNAVSTMVAKHGLDGVIPVGYATQLFRYRKPVIDQADDFCSNDHQHFNGSTLKYYEPSAIGKYLQALVFARALLGEVPTCSQFSSQSSDAELARQCAVDACAATDYSNYGQGTYNFSWSVKFKNGDAEISSMSVTNGASATVPNTSELSGPSGKVFSGWSGEKTKRASKDVTINQVQYTSAQVSTDPVYDDIVWTAVWGTTADEPAVEPGGDEPGGGDEPSGGDEPAPAEGQTILSTTPTDYGYTRQVQIGADVYTVNVYTNTRAAGWELTIPSGVTSIDYLVVGGGGGGGAAKNSNDGYACGGGGAGGFLAENGASVSSSSLTITVGGGGAAGANGNPSVLTGVGSSEVRAFGGGHGGGYTGATLGEASAGGSGGGGAYGKNGASCEEGQGFAGADKGGSAAGGGGGASEKGKSASGENGGDGGAGEFSDITGQYIQYAGGGGGSNRQSSGTPGKGGAGGGGDAGAGATSKGSGTAGSPGVDGTGGGGGGAGRYIDSTNGATGGAGGSGIVVVRYRDPNAKVSLTDATVELFPAAAEYTISAQSFSLGSLTLANGTFIHANTLTKGTDYTISPESVGPECGSHTVTVTGLGRYSDSAATTFEIYKATPTLSGSVVQPDWTQGQTPPAPENTLSTTYGSVIVRYYADAACTQAFTPSAATEPGTYYVRGEVDASSNWYAAATDPESFTVSAATPGPDDPTEAEYTIVKNWETVSGGWDERTIERKSDGQQFRVAKFTTVGDTQWTVPPGVTSFDYLVVGGGGSGGIRYAGGGGGGGMVEGTVSNSATDYAITVGAGGAARAAESTKAGYQGYTGYPSSLQSSSLAVVITANGGGGGGATSKVGLGGGSGGGGGYLSGGGTAGGAVTEESAGSFSGDGVTGTRYANPGGKGSGDTTLGSGGGGGGAGAPGADSSKEAETSGIGGDGRTSTITGESVCYACGGGAGFFKKETGAAGGEGEDGGGHGGGANGSDAGTGGTAGSQGTPGTGGGGGGSGTHKLASGAGGSGVVIIRYAVPATPTEEYEVVEDWSEEDADGRQVRTIRRLSDSAVFIVEKFSQPTTEPLNWSVPTGVTSFDYLVVGGGGSGANRYGGGGGAGGMIEGTVSNSATDYTITVGAGGEAPETAPQSGTAYRKSGNKGADSILQSGSAVIITAKGGGGGKKTSDKSGNSAGGSGGGGSFSANDAGTADAGLFSGSGVTGTGYANAGGKGSQDNTDLGSGGGGGGAGRPGADSSTVEATSGIGGAGRTSTITGESVCYAGGGGAGFNKKTNGAAGGEGGGGHGGGGTSGATAATAGSSGTGGGGGGSGEEKIAAGDGGSGVVIIRYAQPAGTQLTADMVAITQSSDSYTGSAIAPTVTVTDGGTTLTLDADYELEGDTSRTDAGDYTITVKGMGDYWGAVSVPWSIAIAENSVSNPTLETWKTGSTPNAPSATAEFGTVRYRYFASDGQTEIDPPTSETPAGSYWVQAYVEADDNGNWTDAESDRIQFLIAPKDKKSIAGATVTVTPAGGSYTGAAFSPSVRVTLDGTDITDHCTATWSGDLIEVGDYSLTVAAKGDSLEYQGTVSSAPGFAIAKADIAAATVAVSPGSGLYTGAVIAAPTVTVKLGNVDISASCDATWTPGVLKEKGAYEAVVTAKASDPHYAGTATAKGAFTVLDPADLRQRVPVPAAVTRTYTGQALLSGLTPTEAYTVSETAQTDTGSYQVTLTLTDPTAYAWEGFESESSVTVGFTIAPAENSWLVVPSITLTQWFAGETAGEVSTGLAKFGDGDKTLTWCDASGQALSPNAKPTTPGSYIARVTVAADAAKGNWLELVREIGFTIAEARPTSPVALPSVGDKEWTDEEQTADVPESPLWTVKANVGGSDVGSYTVTLALTEAAKAHHRWKVGGTLTADDQEISWRIVQATNAWVTEPSLSASRVASGAPTANKGEARFGEVVQSPATLPTGSGRHEVTFTVAGTANYTGLKRTLAYTVGGSDPGAADTSAQTYEWAHNQSGQWNEPANWTGGGTRGYPDSLEYATALFDDAAAGDPVLVSMPAMSESKMKALTIGGSAPTLTFDWGGAGLSSKTRTYSTFVVNDGGTIAADKTVRLENGFYRFFQNGGAAHGLTLGEGATLIGNVRDNELTTNHNPSKDNGQVVLARYTQMGARSRFVSEGEASIVVVDNLDGDQYTIRAEDGGLFEFNKRFSDAIDDGNSYGLGSGLAFEISDGMIATIGSAVLGAKAGQSLTIEGVGAEFFAQDSMTLGSTAAVTQPLVVKIAVPAEGFLNDHTRYKWISTGTEPSQTTVDAPIASAGPSLTINADVAFEIDLSARFAAQPDLSVLSIARANKLDGSGVLNVPADLDAWYNAKFTLKGVDKSEWTLYKDESSQTLQLRRKGAWEYSDSGVVGYTWTAAVDGAWNDASRWNAWRVPRSLTTAYVRFGNNYGNVPFTVDLSGGDDVWQYVRMAIPEVVDITFRDGKMEGLEFDKGVYCLVKPGSRLTFDNVTFVGPHNNFKVEDGADPARFTFVRGASMADGTILRGTTGGGLIVRDGHSRFKRLMLGETNNAGKYWDDPNRVFELLVTNAQVDVTTASLNNTRFRAVGENTTLTVGELARYDAATTLLEHRSQIAFEALDGAVVTLGFEYPHEKNGQTYGDENEVQRNQTFRAANGTLAIARLELGHEFERKLTSQGVLTPINYQANVSESYIEVSGAAGAVKTTSGGFAIGSDLANATTDTPPELRVTFPKEGRFVNNEGGAAVSAMTTAEVGKNTKLVVDLSEVRSGERFPLVRGTTVTATDLAALKANMVLTGVDSEAAAAATLEIDDAEGASGQVLYLNCEKGQKTVVLPPEIPGKVYTGAPQRSGVQDTDLYAVTMDAEHTDVGTYRTVILTLSDPDNYTWADTDEPSLTLAFAITPAANEWTTKAAVNPPWWNVGGSGTLTPPVARFGADTMTAARSWSGDGLPTEPGTYTVTYTVPEGPNWGLLTTTISFHIYPAGVTPVGPQDTEACDYVWGFNGDGYWTVTNNWYGSAGATYGYPVGLATARFTRSYYAEPVRVTGPQDVSLAALRFEAEARGVTLDFAGHAFSAAEVSLGNASRNVFAGGTFDLDAVKVDDGISGDPVLVFAEGAVATVSGLTYDAAKGLTLTAEGGASVTFDTASATASLEGIAIEVDDATVTANSALGVGKAASAATRQSVLTFSGESAMIKSGGAMTIGGTTADRNSPKLVFELPAEGFAAAPLQTAEGKTLTVNSGTYLEIDARALTKPTAGNAASYPLVLAGGTLTCDVEALAARTTIRLPQNTTAEFKIDPDNAKQAVLSVEWLALNAREPVEVDRVYTGAEQVGYSSPGTSVELGGVYRATTVGDYEFTATPVAGSAWSDGGGNETRTFTWSITAAGITSVTLTATEGMSPPAVATVTANGQPFSNADAGWDVTYSRTGAEGDFSPTADLTTPGKVWVKVTGKANLSGTAVAEYTIIQRDISQVEWTVDYTNFWYTGKLKTYPTLTGTLGDYTLREGQDYDISVHSPNEARSKVNTLDTKPLGIQTWYIRATGKGGYSGYYELPFRVVRQTYTWTSESGATGDWESSAWQKNTLDNVSNEVDRLDYPTAISYAYMAPDSGDTVSVKLDGTAEAPREVDCLYMGGSGVNDKTAWLHDGYLKINTVGGCYTGDIKNPVMGFSNVTFVAASGWTVYLKSYSPSTKLIFAGTNVLPAGVVPQFHAGHNFKEIWFENGQTTLDGGIGFSAAGPTSTIGVRNATVGMQRLVPGGKEGATGNLNFKFVLGAQNQPGGSAMMTVAESFALGTACETYATINAKAKTTAGESFDILTVPTTFDVNAAVNGKTPFAPATLSANTTCAPGFTNAITVVTNEAAGLQTIRLTIRQLVSVPTAVSGLVYSGSLQTGVSGYDQNLMSVVGDAVAQTGARTYTTTFALEDPAGYCWADGTSEAKTVVWSIARPVYETTLGGSIAVDPEVMKTLFGNEMTSWQAEFKRENGTGVAGWEAYVLGLTSPEEWTSLSMIVVQNPSSSADLELSIPAGDRALLSKKTKRLVSSSGELKGVTSVKYELVTATDPLGDFAPYGTDSATPSFTVPLAEIESVRYFKINRKYTFKE